MTHVKPPYLKLIVLFIVSVLSLAANYIDSGRLAIFFVPANTPASITKIAHSPSCPKAWGKSAKLPWRRLKKFLDGSGLFDILYIR
jgi:hypothetical protein